MKLSYPPVQEALKKIEIFAAHVENAMREGEVQRSGLSDSRDLRDQNTVASQIREMWELKETGAISESEFEAEKTRLLASAAH